MTNRAPYEYPRWVPPRPRPSQASRASINRASAPRSAPRSASSSSAQERGFNVPAAAVGSPVPIVYGRAAVSPLIFAAAVKNAKLYLGCVWCVGEISSVTTFYDGDTRFNTTVASYMGTTSQGVDPSLAAVIPNYSDRLSGKFLSTNVAIAYSVFQIPVTVDFPSGLQAVVVGRKVRDPRAGNVRAWSDNPALCLADFIEDRIYGLGVAVDDTSLRAAANYCDERMGDGRRRHTLNLAITNKADVSDHIEALRTYANCWVVHDGNEIKLVPMRPGTPVADIGEDIMVEGSIDLNQISTQDLPTAVGVTWTDSRSWPWKQVTERIYHPDLFSSDLELRESVVRLEGIHNRSQAYRAALQRLNYANLVNLRCSAAFFDEALAYQVGDIVRLSHQWGLMDKPMRVIGVNAIDTARYRLEMEEYDPGIYSDDIETDPEYPDTGLPPPDQVPPVRNLTATEELWQTDKGFYLSRMRIAWQGVDVSSYPFPTSYKVIVRQLDTGLAVFQQQTSITSIATPPLEELKLYTVSVRAEAQWGGLSFVSAWEAVTIQFLGKFMRPADVPWIKGFEAGGEVFLRWDEAPDIDIWRYDLRYGPVGVPWEQPQRDPRLMARALLQTNTFLALVDGLSYRTLDVPEGDWDIMIKAVDSVGNESMTEARLTLTVTHDIDKTNFARYDYTQSVGSSNVYHFRENNKDVYVSDCGVLWDTLFPNLLDSYTNVLDSYTQCSSEFLSEIKDWDRQIQGTWKMENFDARALGGGAITRNMMLRDPSGAWQNHVGLSALGSADQSRAQVTATAGNAFRIEMPQVEIAVYSEPKSRSGTARYNGGAPVVVTLSSAVHAFTSIVITPTGFAPGTNIIGVVDTMTPGSPSSFSAVLIDLATNTRVAGNFLWRVDGI